MNRPPRVQLNSQEDVQPVLEAVGLALHAGSRMGGEAIFDWEIAEIIRQVGRVYDAHWNDPRVARAFGSGYEKGTMSPEERIDHLFKLIREARQAD